MEVAEVGAETATVQNGKVEQQVTIEDCPEAGDADATVTIKLTKQPAAAVTVASDDASEDDIEEEIIEVVEGDADGETVEVTETVQVVKQQEVTEPVTMTTVTVIKKQDDSVGDGSTTTTTTTTTVVRKASVAEPAPDATATADEPTNTQTTTTVKKTITTTASAPTPTPTQTPVSAEKEVVVEPKQQQQATKVVEEEEIEEEEEEEEEEDEEEEEVEDAKDEGESVAKTNASSIPTTKPQNETEPATETAAAPAKEPAAAATPATAAAVAPEAAPVPAAAPVDTAQQQQQQQKQDNLNNTLKEIISDIDRDIEQQEDVAKLKAQQLELLKQQQALAQQIRQQQLLSQQLAAQNKLQEQQLHQQQYQPQQYLPQATAAATAAPPGNVSKSTTIEESQHENGYTRKNESYEVEEKDGLRLTRLTKSTVEESHTSGGMPPIAGIPAARPAFFDRYGTSGAATSMPYQHSWQNTSNTSHVEESSNVSKRIDLQKIFTPATDAEEILPLNRKLYASSAFYSPSLHPTVEDQVELARRISHSLSDISNHQSKGQSMYVNRKKRSVKWVHEGSGKAKKDTSLHDYEYEETSKENTDYYNNDVSTATTSTTSTTTSTTGQLPLTKVPLKLVMNPRGQIRDFNSVRESLNIETGLMSPDKCAELVTALNTQKGKGAELFAKRRRKAEKWVVDETNAGTQSPSGLPDYHQYQPRPPTSPSIVPAYSDAGKHRVQLNMHQEQMLEKYAKPGLKVVKTPWEAALETGSASAAFVEEHKLSPYSNQPTPNISPAPAPLYLDNRAPSPYPAASSATDGGSYADFAPQPYQQQTKLPQAQYQPTKPSAYNSQRDLAYKPNIAQGWKAPSMTLPKDFHSLAQDYQQQQQEQQQQQQQLEYQQEQQQRQVSDAAKKCAAQTNKDEEELISYMERAKLVPPAAMHDFGNHLVRSPELLVSPMPRKNLLLYDNAVHEFQEALDKQQQQQQRQQQQHHSDQIKQQQHVTDNKNETGDAVDVAKQLQQFKEYQQYVAMQQLQEEQLLQQRKARQRERENELQYQREWRKQQATKTEQQQQQPCTADQLEQLKDEQQQQQQEENYVKVAVRDLITTFEQQSAAEAKKIEKEQQKLQEWKVRQQQAPDKTRAADRQQQQLHYKQQQQQQQQVLQQKQTKQMSYEEFLRGKEAQNRQQSEQQQQQQQQKQQPQHEKQHYDDNSRIPTETSNSSSTHNITEMIPAANDFQELYVPKEIPLESYAPPPAVSTNIYNKPSAPTSASHSWSPTQAAYAPSSYPSAASAPSQQYPSSYPNYSSAPQAKPQSSFPLSKPGGGYSSTYAPPKQAYLPPSSYQTVQQLTGQAPQVSFNPSPLPYDKLAKFENPSPPEISSPRRVYSPYRALGVPGAGSRVRNVSPAPYGARPTSGASQVYPPALSPQAAAYGNGAAGAASPNYGTPGSSRPPSQQYSSYGATHGYENGSSSSSYRPSTADLAHCQNFNNAARGWGAGRAAAGPSHDGAGYRNTKPVAAACHLPYSDF